MNKFLPWIQNIMRQTNGFDDLSKFLLKTGAVIGLAGFLLSSPIITWIGFIIIVLMYARTFMKDKQKFYQQNRKYHAFRNRIINYFNGQKNLVDQKQKQYVYRQDTRYKKRKKPDRSYRKIVSRQFHKAVFWIAQH